MSNSRSKVEAAFFFSQSGAGRSDFGGRGLFSPPI